MDWKELPLIDQDLIKFLKKKFLLLEYNLDMEDSFFMKRSIFNAGQRSVIEYLETTQRKQRGK